MHFRRVRLVALLLIVRGTLRIAPIVSCVVLAAKLRAAPAPVVMTPSDPSPAPIAQEIAPPPTPTPVRAQPPLDALTTSSVLTEIRMVTPRVAWAWGQDTTLSRSDDGGRTWTSIGPTGCDYFVQGPLRAWVVTCDTLGARVHFTTDGGRTWSYATTATDDTRAPISASALQFTDATHGFVALSFGFEGEDTWLFRTTDGGRTWKKVSSSPPDATPSFADAQRGWRSSTHVLERTTDGGETWTPHPDLAACVVDMVPSFEDRAGVVVGSCRSGVHVFYTYDGGERWTAGAKVDLSDPAVAVQGGAQAWLWSSSQPLVRTRDGGRSLDTSADAVAPSTSYQLVAPSRGLMVSSADDDLVVSRSIDGGRTFSTVLVTPSATVTDGASFSDADHGLFFTSYDTGTRVLSTSDGGASWRFLR